MTKTLQRVNQTRRASAEIWVDAAYEQLIAEGVDSIRIVPLAEKLNLSRTSFYWVFDSRDALLEAVLERWRAKNTPNLILRTEQYAEGITEAIFNVFDCWLDTSLFDSDFEFSVRSWALQSTQVSQEIRDADAIRIDALTRMYARFGFDALTSDVRARTMYLTQVGYISMRPEEDLATRMLRVPDYVEIFGGQPAHQKDMDRFFARHNHSR